MSTIKLKFVSIGSNPVSNSADWGPHHYLAYVGSQFVVIYNAKVSRQSLCVIVQLIFESNGLDKSS